MIHGTDSKFVHDAIIKLQIGEIDTNNLSDCVVNLKCNIYTTYY